MFAVATHLGLQRDELIDLASYLLRRDISSSKQLDEEQVGRMLDALEGFELVTALIAQRPPS